MAQGYQQHERALFCPKGIDSEPSLNPPKACLLELQQPCSYVHYHTRTGCITSLWNRRC